MSYQIKSTPFFQRMLTTSKLNGQLQMLKEEFERMHFFDDRNLEKKIKEVRLKRLFREVEEIRESDSKKAKIDPKIKPRTKESERIENLKKAKSLGQYYSQRNCENIGIISSNGALGDKRRTLAHPRPNPESGLKRGIKYGNEISDWNMQRIKLSNFRKEFAQENIKKQEKGSSKEEKIKRKICYSNVNKTSSHNKKKSTINHKYLPQPEDNPSVIGLGRNVQLIDLERVDDNMFKSCTDIHDAILIDNSNIKLMLSCSSSENIRTKRAIVLWHKVFALLKRHILQRQKLKTLQFLNSRKSNQNISDYQLRSISNGTNLPETNFIPNRTDQFHKNLIETDEECKGERLINTEYLFGAISPKILDNEMPRFPPPPPSPPPITIPIFTNKKYPFHLNRKPSENNVNNSNDNQKENFKLKVETLKSLFEHQSK